MLYLIFNGNFVKVGYSKDIKTLKNRRSAYNTHNPFFTDFADISCGTITDEMQVHEIMSSSSDFLRLNDGEWYKCINEQLLAELKEKKLSYFLGENYCAENLEKRYYELKSNEEQTTTHWKEFALEILNEKKELEKQLTKAEIRIYTLQRKMKEIAQILDWNF